MRIFNGYKVSRNCFRKDFSKSNHVNLYCRKYILYGDTQHTVKKLCRWHFLGGPVVKTVCFPCRGDGLTLCQEDEILHASKCRGKKLCRQLKLNALGSDTLYYILVHWKRNILTLCYKLGNLISQPLMIVQTCSLKNTCVENKCFEVR